VVVAAVRAVVAAGSVVVRAAAVADSGVGRVAEEDAAIASRISSKLL
jgi:hypothetical protein